MSACSVHIHTNKAVLLLFCLCLCFLGDKPTQVTFSLYFDLSFITCCATSIPRNNTAYPFPFHTFSFSLCLFVYSHEYGGCKVLAFWTTSASLVFHSLLMWMVSAQSVGFGVLICEP